MTAGNLVASIGALKCSRAKGTDDNKDAGNDARAVRVVALVAADAVNVGRKIDAPRAKVNRLAPFRRRMSAVYRGSL